MVRTAPNSISRRQTSTAHPYHSSPPSVTESVSRNNLNRFFDKSNTSLLETPSHHHRHSLYPTAPPCSRPPKTKSADPIHLPQKAQTTWRKPTKKLYFLGVFVPRNSHSIIKECSKPSRRHRTLSPKLNPAHQSPVLLNRHCKKTRQQRKKKTVKNGWPTTEQCEETERIADSINPLHHSSADLEHAEGDIVTQVEFDGLLELDQVEVDDQSYRKGDAVFIVPDSVEIPEDFEPDSYWLAIITDIRHRDLLSASRSRTSQRIPQSQVFLKVDWFYRYDDFDKLKKTNPVFQKIVIKLKKLGFRSNEQRVKSTDIRYQDKELIRTDHSTIIHLNSLAGKADVYKFNDQAPPNSPKDQPVYERCSSGGLDSPSVLTHKHRIEEEKTIGIERYYYRLSLHFMNHRHSRVRSKHKALSGLFESIDLMPHDKFGCKCKKPYNPEEEIMIFDFKRQEWLHMRCLLGSSRIGPKQSDAQYIRSSINALKHPSNLLVHQQHQGLDNQAHKKKSLSIQGIKDSVFNPFNLTSSSSSHTYIPSDFFENQSSDRLLLRGMNLSLSGHLV
ncbi:hypothetical protein MJO28_008233 [Puccinia striiformis f. sp. tritici]|uniref:Uncharacterized protein n=1 Tax=Puccinia striiformis f. sp. tritici TaxID=168172 RepID=A0ACC0E9X8_9BASI|nr:hypothetical protein MJO28_008233 [Puccinia striiformis f. sp. tritici]